MKNFLMIMLALVALAGCGDPDGGDVLTVYAAGPRPLAEAAVRTFTEETGIPVNLYTATTGQIMAKLEAEKYRPRADVVILASALAGEALAQAGRLEAYVPADIGETRAEWHHPEHFYHGSAGAAVGIATRKDAPLPDVEWRDVLSGGVGGRTLMPSPSRSGTSGEFVLAWLQNHGEAGWDDFKEARRGGLEFAGANNQAITSLLVGSHQTLVGAVDYLVYAQIARGEALEMRFPKSGALVVARPIMVMKGSRHPENARRFLDSYFAPATQREVAAMHLIPARTDVALSEVRREAAMPEAMPLDTARALATQRRVMRRFQFEVERAVAVP
jgi:iron(III) transport system substrate-binding protein